MASNASQFLIGVVEDDDSVRRSLQLNLELEGFRVVTAPDGEAGVEMVDEHNPGSPW